MDLNENEKIIRFNKDNIYLRSLHKTEFKLLPYYHDISVGKYDLGSLENSWDNVFSKVVNAETIYSGPLILTAAGVTNTQAYNDNGLVIPEVLRLSGNVNHDAGMYSAQKLYLRFNCGNNFNSISHGLVLSAEGSTLSSPLAVANAVTATSFIKSGSDNTKVLLGGGGDKALSDFAMRTDLSDFAMQSSTVKLCNMTIEPNKTYWFRCNTAIGKALVFSRRLNFGGSKVFSWTGYNVDYNRNDISIICDNDMAVNPYVLKSNLGFAIKNTASNNAYISIFSNGTITYEEYNQSVHGELTDYYIHHLLNSTAVQLTTTAATSTTDAKINFIANGVNLSANLSTAIASDINKISNANILAALTNYVPFKQRQLNDTVRIHAYNNIAIRYDSLYYKVIIPGVRTKYAMYGLFFNMRTYDPYNVFSFSVCTSHGKTAPYSFYNSYVLYNGHLPAGGNSNTPQFKVYAQLDYEGVTDDVFYISGGTESTISLTQMLLADEIAYGSIDGIKIEGITRDLFANLTNLYELPIKKSIYQEDMKGSNIVLTGYSKNNSVSAIAPTDNINQALGKLEYKVDDVRTKVLSIDLLLNVANPSDTTVDRLIEVFNVLSGINDTDTIQSIIGKYLPLTGGTLVGDLVATGDIIADSATVHDRPNNISMFINKTSVYNKPVARHTYAIKMGENTLFNAGFCVNNSTLQYVYMGVQNSYSHQNNFRIYPDHVQSNAFVKNGSDENHVLLGNGDHKALSELGAAYMRVTEIDLTDRRTIGGLKEALSEFVAANLSKMGATGRCSFRVDTMVNRWNNTQGLDAAEVDTQGLDPGGNVQFTIISPHNTSDYALLRMTTYLNNEVYYICLYGRTWQKIYRSAAVLTSHLPIGSVTRPVYVNENGAIQPCNDKLDVNISKPVLIKMDNDTSNCKSSVDFFASNGTTKLASICYFNKTNRILLNVGNLTNLWYEDALKSTLSIGTDDVRYRGYPMLHTGNIDAYNLYTFKKTLHITQDWQDTGILYNDLPSSGTYAVLVYIYDNTNTIYHGYYSGIMSWWADGTTNGGLTDEIMLHAAGHFTAARIFLRTLEVTNTNNNDNYLRLLIASHENFTGNTTITFKFKKLI